VASDREFVAFVCEQLRGAGEISSRRMFGQAAVYLEDKVVGLVFDNQLFVKATERVRTTADALPVPRKRGKRNSRSSDGKKMPKGVGRRN
jgi:TfoX/Sxy family transcriptional regulator of competence genes